MEYAAVSALIALVLSCISLLQVWRANIELKKKTVTLSTEIQQLKNHLLKVSDGSIGVGQRLIHVEQKLAASEEKQAGSALRQADSLQYSVALKLLDEGVSFEQLAEQSQLSPAELQLMQLIHSSSKETDSATM